MKLKKTSKILVISICFFLIIFLNLTPSPAPFIPQESAADTYLSAENSMRLPLIPLGEQTSKISDTQQDMDPLSAFDDVIRQPSIDTVIEPTSILDQKEKKGVKKKTKKKKPQEKTVAFPTTSLNFDIENQTGKTIYVTCFSYIKKRTLGNWRWDKSPIYKLDQKGTATIEVDLIKDEQDRVNVFGYLAVFETEKEASESIYELLDDHKKLDLDQLIHLQNKKVVIEIEKYGIVGEFYEYDFVKKKQTDTTIVPELDFLVENQTGKVINVVCYVYQKRAKGTWLAQKTTAAWTTINESRDDMSVWRFDKTPIITLNPGESKMVDVDTIIEPRDREYVKGSLAIYDENELKEADLDVYELLPAYRKLELGTLSNLKNKKIIVNVEQYGSTGQFMDFMIKPAQRIDFSKFKQ